MNQTDMKVVRGVSLTGALWEQIDKAKSSQISRSGFIGMAVEEYIQNHKMCIV